MPTAQEEAQKHTEDMQNFQAQIDHSANVDFVKKEKADECPNCKKPWNGTKCSHCGYPKILLND